MSNSTYLRKQVLLNLEVIHSLRGRLSPKCRTFNFFKKVLDAGQTLCYSIIAVARETTSNLKDLKKDKKVVDKLSNT